MNLPGEIPLRRTALHALHVGLGAKMVPFAGYDMPVQFKSGIIAEHLHVRSHVGLFDVAHMGQITLRGAGAAEALERLVPADIRGLVSGRLRYTMFTNDAGGILDDIMVANLGDRLHLVVNAACSAADLAHLKAGLTAGISIDPVADQSLIAIQGPEAAAVLERFLAGVAKMGFMSVLEAQWGGRAVLVSRSGYTGEDGFEISVPDAVVVDLAERLLAEAEVRPIGLGARDSLRLEAGLCLYGHDIDATTTPVEAGLGWTIGKRRRSEGGFPGAGAILRELDRGTSRRRVGIKPDGRAPARDSTVITDVPGRRIGVVTSGGYGPAVAGPIAMGYIEDAFAAPGTAIRLVVRDVPRPARVVALPFVPHRYAKS